MGIKETLGSIFGRKEKPAPTFKELYGLPKEPLEYKLVECPTGTIGTMLVRIPTNRPKYAEAVGNAFSAMKEKYEGQNVEVTQRRELDPKTGELVKGDEYTVGRYVIIAVSK